MEFSYYLLRGHTLSIIADNSPNLTHFLFYNNQTNNKQKGIESYSKRNFVIVFVFSHPNCETHGNVGLKMNSFGSP